MNNPQKQLSNPFSTGGGGPHFEAHVQASFVTLMLTGGYTPCLPCWPVAKVKLQGKIDEFETDDLIVFAENRDTKEIRKLLGQVKHAVSFIKSDEQLKDVINAAWSDFNNPRIFNKSKDVIALISGPLTAKDFRTVPWLLEQAKRTASVDEFFRNVKQANFSPSGSSDKLEVLRHHLKSANRNRDLADDQLYYFLRHFYWCRSTRWRKNWLPQPLLSDTNICLRIEIWINITTECLGKKDRKNSISAVLMR